MGALLCFYVTVGAQKLEAGHQMMKGVGVGGRQSRVGAVFPQLVCKDRQQELSGEPLVLSLSSVEEEKRQETMREPLDFEDVRFLQQSLG